MADMRHGERNQRRVARDQVRAFGLGVAGERADLDVAVLQRDAVEPVDVIDVDQQRRVRQPHVQRGDQALAAGEDARVAAAAPRLPSSSIAWSRDLALA